MNRSIRAIIVYNLNDFKRVHSKIYSDISTSTQKNLCVADLIIKDMRLIKNFQANTSFDDDFVKNFLIIVNKVDIIEADTSTSTKVIIFKFLILKVVSVTSRKTLQAEKIDQLNKLNVVLSAVNSILFQIRFFNLNKKIFVFLSIKTVDLQNMNSRLLSIKTF